MGVGGWVLLEEEEEDYNLQGVDVEAEVERD